MNELNDILEALELAKRFEEYRIQKSWGFMVIITGLVILYMRLQWDFELWLTQVLSLEETFVFWQILVPISWIIFLGMILLPIFIALIIYLSTKQIIIKEGEISSKRYVLFGLTLFFFYLSSYLWLPELLSPIVFLIFFPGSLTIENGGIVINYDSKLQGDANWLIVTGFAFLVSYYFLRKIVRNADFKALIIAGFILIINSLILIIIYHQVIAPTQNSFVNIYEFERFISGVTTIIFFGCYEWSGISSIRKASQRLEGGK